jgi:hypothetical protein
LDVVHLVVSRQYLEAKRAALERMDPPSSRRPRWKREPGLIEWLESL